MTDSTTQRPPWLGFPARALAAVLILIAAHGYAEEEVPFSMPVLEGWRTETIPFPLEFAPDLPYTGLEELRFAPGMFDVESEEFWTYAFVWWVAPDSPDDPASLSTHLESYFRGLAHAVAESREFTVGDATFAASIEDGPASSFYGTAETFDAFVTGDQVRLSIRGNSFLCENQERRVIIFALSPQPADHPVWDELDAIRSGFRCDS